MPQGVIKRLVAERGFGFVSGERDDIFFHRSAVADDGFADLREGQTVEYELEDEETAAVRGAGPRALSVRPV
jgi:CspA family cold shock protein